MQEVGKNIALSKIDFLAGSTLLIDKPLEWTSFDAVNKLRYAISRKLGVKRVKVGHAGTLDPLATGLLLICTGKATKTIEQLQKGEKEYIATIKLGATTPTYDSEMEEDGAFPYDHITKELLSDCLEGFTGTIDQRPPIFSALKKNGKALYKYARKGQHVEIPTRKVVVHSIELLDFSLPHFTIKVVCGKGTYIRSMAHDIGQALDSGGYLTALRRTRIGDYSVTNALSIEQFVNDLEEAEMTIVNAQNP